LRSLFQARKTPLGKIFQRITLATMNEYLTDKWHRQSGMTLIELLVVITLAGMLTSWGVSHWRHYQQALRLEHTAQQLLAFLGRLQNDANWRNRAALLWIKTGNPWCVGSGEPPPNCTSDNGWVFKPDYQDVELVGFTQKEMGFYGLRNNAQAGHIQLGNGAGQLRLVLSAKGRLRLCSEGKVVRGIALCQP
jgi:prepilin peptidase dependent protein A